uniref:Uncharacterized protein n=1 Tax=Candidatus Kentrum sp. DK TaxID=2126562 RepID=A0A450TLV7_9GAMM|nr:MAG: hypothetical protein BECKDK2373C_GA0170839_11922 [Candidatus Kentron sp. DK]
MLTPKNLGNDMTYGARAQWMCVFVYKTDADTEPAIERAPMTFTQVYLGKVGIDDFRKNPRGEIGTRTATLHKDGINPVLTRLQKFNFRISMLRREFFLYGTTF